MTIKLLNGDCREMLKALPSNSVDACVTDPPYGLSFMGKAWDYDVPGVETWREVFRVLKPGAHLLSFFGSRTYHRGVIPIEDAGFEIRDQIMWLYGSGFPKSHDISKGIDAHLGAEREITGYAKRTGKESGKYGAMAGNNALSDPSSDAAKQWEGWGTALKPAHEPIVVARKPLAELDTNVLESVEVELRKRGVTGEIKWKFENANGAKNQKPQINSLSTEAQSAAVISVESAGERETPSAGPQIPKPFETGSTLGQQQTGNTAVANEKFGVNDLETKLSQPTALRASVAEKLSACFLPLTTLTGAAPRTEKPLTERSMAISNATTFQAGTEYFAGIATGLTGSMALVRIARDPQGFFLWPSGVPTAQPGKPLTVAKNMLAHGTGGLNIDGCRVGDFVNDTPSGQDRFNARNADQGYRPGAYAKGAKELSGAEGRWPANVMHDGSDEVLDGFPHTKSGKPGVMRLGENNGAAYGAESRTPGTPMTGFGDEGSAARFFYCAKTSKRDRDEGLDLEPTVTTDGRAVSIDNAYLRGETLRKNNHPTVKPTDLMRYLCRLVTPPGGTVLDPFMGSGSTGKAAILENFNFIGVELSPEYLAIAKARIYHSLGSDLV